MPIVRARLALIALLLQAGRADPRDRLLSAAPSTVPLIYYLDLPGRHSRLAVTT